MIIKELLNNKNKSNFIVNEKKNLKVIDIIKLINKNKLGFIILNSKKLRIITDGDIRRYIANKGILENKVSDSGIGSFKVISIDFNSNLYDASKLIISKKINTLLITKKIKYFLIYRKMRFSSFYLLKESLLKNQK